MIQETRVYRCTCSKCSHNWVTKKDDQRWKQQYYADTYGLNSQTSEGKMTELQLLVIDLGDSCVVKVESLEKEFWLIMDDVDYHLPSCHFRSEGQVELVTHPFPVVRAAIDRLGGEMPVPRLYRDDKGDVRLQLWKTPASDDLQIVSGDYEALCTIAGHPLPIWEPKQGGEWVEVVRSGTYTPSTNETISVSIWRYTLGVKND